MSDFRAGLMTADVRLRGKWTLGATTAAMLVVVVAARILRRSSPTDAVDVVLAGVVFGWTVPVVAYSAVARACRYGRLDEAVRFLARDGANRQSAVAGLVVGTAVRVAFISTLLAFTAVLVARGGLTAHGLSDACTTAWIGAVGGAAYATLFAVGSLMGRRGGGRLAAFLADASAGGSVSMIALPFPRAHVRSLLGGSHVFGLPEWQSTGTLYALVAAFLALCLARTPP